MYACHVFIVAVTGMKMQRAFSLSRLTQGTLPQPNLFSFPISLPLVSSSWSWTTCCRAMNPTCWSSEQQSPTGLSQRGAWDQPLRMMRQAMARRRRCRMRLAPLPLAPRCRPSRAPALPPSAAWWGTRWTWRTHSRRTPRCCSGCRARSGSRGSGLSIPAPRLSGPPDDLLQRGGGPHPQGDQPQRLLPMNCLSSSKGRGSSVKLGCPSFPWSLESAVMQASTRLGERGPVSRLKATVL